MLHSIHCRGKAIQILGASKAKLWLKCLTCRVRSGKEELSAIDSLYALSVGAVALRKGASFASYIDCDEGIFCACADCVF